MVCPPPLTLTRNPNTGTARHAPRIHHPPALPAHHAHAHAVARAQPDARSARRPMPARHPRARPTRPMGGDAHGGNRRPRRRHDAPETVAQIMRKKQLEIFTGQKQKYANAQMRRSMIGRGALSVGLRKTPPSSSDNWSVGRSVDWSVDGVDNPVKMTCNRSVDGRSVD